MSLPQLRSTYCIYPELYSVFGLPFVWLGFGKKKVTLVTKTKMGMEGSDRENLHRAEHIMEWLSFAEVFPLGYGAGEQNADRSSYGLSEARLNIGLF